LFTSKLRALTAFVFTGREHGIAIAAYSPLAPITQFKGVSSDFDQALEEVTQAVSERAGETVTSSQVLLRLASQRQALVVTTSRNKKRTADALKAGGLPELTEEEQKKLLKAAEDAGSHRAFQEHMGELDVEY
jgi:diketogulonate reductase-like aldo/keto reductase